MDKLKYVKLENPDGSYSDSIPLSVSAEYVDITSEENLANYVNQNNIDINDLKNSNENLQSQINTNVSAIQGLANYVNQNNIDINDLKNSDENLQSQINTNTSAIQGLASGSPKGVYNTTALLISSNPETGVYIVSADGHIYSWIKNGSDVVDLGVYQAAEDSDSVEIALDYTTQKISPMQIEGTSVINVLDKTKAIEGKYLTNAVSDTYGTNANFCCTDFIPCKLGDTFEVWGVNGANNVGGVVGGKYYNKKKERLGIFNTYKPSWATTQGSSSWNNIYTITDPDACYVRLNTHKGNWSTKMITYNSPYYNEETGHYRDYIPYGQTDISWFKSSEVEEIKEDIEEINSTMTALEQDINDISSKKTFKIGDSFITKPVSISATGWYGWASLIGGDFSNIKQVKLWVNVVVENAAFCCGIFTKSNSTMLGEAFFTASELGEQQAIFTFENAIPINDDVYISFYSQTENQKLTSSMADSNKSEICTADDTYGTRYSPGFSEREHPTIPGNGTSPKNGYYQPFSIYEEKNAVEIADKLISYEKLDEPLQERISNNENLLEEISTIQNIEIDKSYLIKPETITSSGWYGWASLIGGDFSNIKQVKLWVNITVENAVFCCSIFTKDRTTRLGETHSTATSLGEQELIFTFENAISITDDVYLAFYSQTENQKLASSIADSNKSEICTADDTYGTRYTGNFVQVDVEHPGIPPYSTSPKNGYYQPFIVYEEKKIAKIENKSISIEKLDESLQEKLKEEKIEKHFLMPPKVYTWGDGINGDWEGNRVPEVGIYLDHAIAWGENEESLRFKNERIKNRISFYTPYPIDWTNANINNGHKIQEITKSYTIQGDSIDDINGTITQVSVRNDVGADIFVGLLTLGDSTVEGANSFITKEDRTRVDCTFWNEVGRQFAMDSIEANNVNKYKFAALGTRYVSRNDNVINYLDQTRTITTCTNGISGSRLPDLLRFTTPRNPNQETWDALGLGDGSHSDYINNAANRDLIAQTCEPYTGTEAEYSGINAFFDPNKTGNNRFSIAKWLERYRTLDDNGNRLTLGNGTGTKITSENIDIINVCTPTHVVLQMGLNDWTRESLSQYIADMDVFVDEIKTQLPNAKIAITLFPDDPGTYFPEMYPNIRGCNMGGLHNNTRNWIAALIEHFSDSEDVDLLPIYFVMPPAVSLSYRWSQNDSDGLVKIPFGPASNNYHANGYAHRAWAHQVYAWIKATLAEEIRPLS